MAAIIQCVGWRLHNTDREGSRSKGSGGGAAKSLGVGWERMEGGVVKEMEKRNR